MANQSNNPIKTTKRRRWFRFRLRTLLVMVTLISVLLGWVDSVSWELDQRQRENSTISWVYGMGGGINLRSRNDERSWWGKTKDGLFGERVQVVRIRNTQVSDLSPIAELKNLQYLDLNNTKLTDLSPLTELKNLSEFVLVDSHVSDEQVQKLRLALPNCIISF